MDIFELTFNELARRFKTLYGKGPYHASAVMREILRHGNMNFQDCDEFVRSPDLAARIKKDLAISVPEITRTISEEGTVKYIGRMKDGLETESVVIPMKSHNTLCVSCQIGCRMGCRFCETGSMGFKRNLTTSEIVGQVYAARFVLGKNIKNIVFMGMGEPFDNLSSVLKAIEVLSDQKGFDIAHSHMTLSTAGLVDGINALGAMNLKRLHLAISLNAPNDEIRSRLMPVNSKHSMAELKKALLEYPLRDRGSFLIGYVVIKGLNDSVDHADQLARFLSPLPVRLNLIPLNKTSGFDYPPTEDGDIHRFGSYLEQRGIFVIKRWSRGQKLAAGCGQLGRACES